MKRFLVLVIAGLFAITTFSFDTQQVSSVMLHYGGPTTAILPCEVNLSTLITVGPPRPGVFLDTPTTLRYANFVPALRIGQQQLGAALTTPAPCIKWCPPGPATLLVPVPAPMPCPVGFGFIKVYEGTSL